MVGRTFTINKSDYSTPQLKAWAPDSMDMFIWNKRMTDIEPYIAELNGEIVGYADLQNDGLIDHFFCHQAHQREGIGRALMTHILAQGKQQKIKHYFAQVSITAKPFFEHFGFKVVKQQLVEVRDQELINYHMEKYDEQLRGLPGRKAVLL
ncbi:GNAT family N-acetyltransferase [Psychromonas ossibalaenae]|uniref:GNAT family N-acetyltransferase n=1 Tax=Psychromonas ossibalaenae TaxID=444922 RepID=UPI001FE090A4|nr:GNAT family N-acetyltransferase [Psychromonas ossibalaenae]